MAIDDGPRNSEPQSKDEDDTKTSTLSQKFHATSIGGLRASIDLICISPFIRLVFSVIRTGTHDTQGTRLRPLDYRSHFVYSNVWSVGLYFIFSIVEIAKELPHNANMGNLTSKVNLHQSLYKQIFSSISAGLSIGCLGRASRDLEAGRA
ncbi:hypothetical protein TNCV_2467211 [Trichonephila clavipes]|nr:hypothetical protein TNCV_2467211 [Trichonephila clavipes]